MKKVVAPALLGFGVALAVIIGQRMSTDAMAVVVGVAVGVAASVPTSVLLLAVLRRAQREEGWLPSAGTRASLPPPQPAPQIIVLNPADLLGQRQAAQPPIPQPPLQLAQDAGLRRLRVVGDDDEWSYRET